MSDDPNYDYIDETYYERMSGYERMRGNRLEGEIFDLKEENERLKKEIAELKEVLSYYEARQYDDQISNM